jgi:soluble lytic murein transglycosylase
MARHFAAGLKLKYFALTLAIFAPNIANTADQLSPGDIAIYRQAYIAMKQDKWDKARNLASRATVKLPAKVIEWSYLRHSRPLPLYGTLNSFIVKHGHWPGQNLLRKRAELAALKESSDHPILQFGKRFSPKTGKGRIRYGEALIASGKQKPGEDWIRRAWVNNSFDKRTSERFLKKHKAILRQEDHQARANRLLWHFERQQATRMLKLLSKEDRTVAQARISLHRALKTAKADFAKVPQARILEPGLLYERVRWHRRKKENDDAVIWLKKLGADIGLAPHKWWTERHILIRRALNKNFNQQAFELARAHRQKRGKSSYAEAEWMAGWIALRFLQDPNAAFVHFAKFTNGVETPVSRARGAYWSGRAAKQSNQLALAAQWFQKGASYPSTFYGQMAIEALGQNGQWAPPAKKPEASDASLIFDGREFVRIIRYLNQLDESRRADPFLYQLSRTAQSPAERLLVANLALEVRRPNVSVRLAKLARRNHIGLGTAGYPRLKLPNKKVEQALAHAVIRQESEFRPEAISPAGARGLMQLMPATAKEVARELGLKYNKAKLLEPEYNMKLGTHYLRQMIRKYNGSYIMAAAAYNAGSHRVDRWVIAHGDPRKINVDAIDWIEKIPFSETRNYVQRVMENLQVYRALIAGGQPKLTLMTDLKRGT